MRQAIQGNRALPAEDSRQACPGRQTAGIFGPGSPIPVVLVHTGAGADEIP
jgi:hypothetical protein